MFESLCLGRMLWCESRASICFVGGVVVCADRVSVVAVNSSSVNIIFLISVCFMLPFSGAKVTVYAQRRNRHCAVNRSVIYP